MISKFDEQFDKQFKMMRWLAPIAVLGGLLIAAGFVGAIIYLVSKL